MKRRQFLQWLSGAGIAASGLIVPHRSIFLPPVGGWFRAPECYMYSAKYIEIALGYMVTYKDIADNLYSLA